MKVFIDTRIQIDGSIDRGRTCIDPTNNNKKRELLRRWAPLASAVAPRSINQSLHGLTVGVEPGGELLVAADVAELLAVAGAPRLALLLALYHAGLVALERAVLGGGGARHDLLHLDADLLARPRAVGLLLARDALVDAGLVAVELGRAVLRRRRRRHQGDQGGGDEQRRRDDRRAPGHGRCLFPSSDDGWARAVDGGTLLFAVWCVGNEPSMFI